MQKKKSKKRTVRTNKHTLANTVNITCLAYIGLPEELKKLSIVIAVILTVVIIVSKLKR